MERRPEDRAIEENVKEVPEADMERRPEDRAVEEGVKEVLALSQKKRPKNTRRCYLPKQKEWKASLFPSTLLLFYHFISYPFFYVVPLLICLQGWCKRMAFRPGGEYLPYDWVDEGKLLLFVKTQVAERAPRKGSRLAAEKKRKAKEGAKGSKRKGFKEEQEQEQEGRATRRGWDDGRGGGVWGPGPGWRGRRSGRRYR
jgi:hypothetical protein